MNSHDPKRIALPSARQFWRAFVYVMQVHENRIVKRAGVAGVRARARTIMRDFFQFNFSEFYREFFYLSEEEIKEHLRSFISHFTR